MKTTKQHFETYQTRCDFWLQMFGLRKWELYFEHKNEPSKLAWTKADHGAKIATIGLATDWGDLKPDDYQIDRVAKHEMLHILLNPLYTLAVDRFVNSNQINDAEEEIVMMLEKVVFEP